MEKTSKHSLLILVGPKHSGKTSTGKALAKLISGTFFDLDDELARLSGKSPRELFLQGEQAFREAELGAAKHLLQLINMEQHTALHEPYIIATGGGIVDNPPAMDLLKHSGTIIYLELSPETAWKRIQITAERSGSLPPFLRTGDPEKTHRKLHERRANLYRELADLIIDAEQEPPELRANIIFQHLKQI